MAILQEVNPMSIRLIAIPALDERLEYDQFKTDQNKIAPKPIKNGSRICEAL